MPIFNDKNTPTPVNVPELEKEPTRHPEAQGAREYAARIQPDHHEDADHFGADVEQRFHPTLDAMRRSQEPAPNNGQRHSQPRGPVTSARTFDEAMKGRKG